MLHALHLCDIRVFRDKNFWQKRTDSARSGNESKFGENLEIRKV